jgi:hypothetical protein
VRAALGDLAAVEHEDLVPRRGSWRNDGRSRSSSGSPLADRASVEQRRLVNSLGRFVEVAEQQA